MKTKEQLAEEYLKVAEYYPNEFLRVKAHFEAGFNACLSQAREVGDEEAAINYVGSHWRAFDDVSKAVGEKSYLAGTQHGRRSERAKLQRDQFVPGQLECKKCGFVLISKNIYMKSGTIGPNNKSDDCANGCGPMWKVSWKDHAAKVRASSEALFEQLEQERERSAKLMSALKASCYCDDPAYRSIEKCVACEAVESYERGEE